MRTPVFEPNFSGSFIKQQIPDSPGLGVPPQFCRWGLALGVFWGVGAWNLGYSATADWPQWGGQSSRNMYSPAKGLPDSLGKVEFKAGTEEVDAKGIKHLRWAVKLGSQSYGN